MHTPVHPILSRPLRLLGVLAAVCAVLAGSFATPVGAQTPADGGPTTTAPAATSTSIVATPMPKTTTTTTTTAAAGGTADVSQLEAMLPALTPITDAATMETLRGRYGSLSAALVSLYAGQVGQPIDAFMAANSTALASALGASEPGALVAAGALANGDLTDLNAALEGNGMALDWRSGGSLDSYSVALAKDPSSLEARVVAAGAGWAAQVAGVRTPGIEQPDMPSLGGSALAVGLFADRATTAMVTDFPDLFAQVRSSGVGTPQAAAAWRESMVNALAATSADFSAALPSPCYGAMMTAMASGDAAAARAGSGANCGTCVSTGLYLNGQMSRLFDPRVTTTQTNPLDNFLPPAEFNQLQPWQREAITAQNPDLGTGLGATLSGSAPVGGCGGSAAASNAASTILPGVFSGLQQRR